MFEFLVGLNRELNEVRGRVSGRKPLNFVGEVFSEVCQEENHQRVMTAIGSVGTSGIGLSREVSMLNAHRGWLVRNDFSLKGFSSPYGKGYGPSGLELVSGIQTTPRRISLENRIKGNSGIYIATGGISLESPIKGNCGIYATVGGVYYEHSIRG